MTASLLTALLLAADPAAQGSAPPTQTVEVTGEAYIPKNADGSLDVPAGIEQARYAAFRNALEQVGGTLVSGISVTENNTLVSDKILAHAQGYIRHFTPIGEPDVGGASVSVKLRCEVGVAELDKDLEAVKAMLAMKGKPRVVILVAEQQVGMSEPLAWWNKSQKEAKGDVVAMDLGTFENTFIDAIKNNGWTFIDHDAVEGKLKTHSAFQTDLSTPQVIEFAKLSEAQVAIVGRVVASNPGPSDLAAGMLAGTANVSLRAINCDNGEILGTLSKTIGDITTLDASAQNAGQKALRLAGIKAAEMMQAKILERWQSDFGGTSRITMKVTGVPSYKALQDFEKALTATRGVKGVEERSADGSDAELDLDVTGTSKMLAKQIDSKSVKGKAVNIKHVSANEVDVSFGK